MRSMQDKYYQHNTHNVYVNKASETFKKSIPFKIYNLKNDNLSGTNVHTHDYMQIWYVRKGCLKHTVEGKSNIMVKGTIFILPPFVVHQVDAIEDEDINVIGCEFVTDFINESIIYNQEGTSINSSLFDFAYLEPFLVSSENIKPGLHLTGNIQNKVETLLDDMLCEFNSERKYYKINIKADLLKLLAIISREYENSDNEKNPEVFDRYRDAINNTIKYIDENFNKDLSLEDASRMAMMSPAYFSFIFKQITGKTFVEYKNSLRLAKAIDLLNEVNLSISDICYEVGFNDTAYFSKIFKKETGISPRQYRKIFQKSGSALKTSLKTKGTL
ncbi:MAG: helix-turn-helix transcriptional regulator [Clostridiaceae bacterium]|nr:helix-turn-helix transcriptional regulator [Clostridiaceae bacterium]